VTVKSASFVERLKAHDRVVITVAAATRAAFGCAEKNAWTNFGKADIDRALRETRDVRAAFDRTATQVAQSKAEQGQSPSGPKIATGSAILPAPDRLSRARH